MSTLKVNDIQEATSGGGKIFPPRAWVNFDGSSTPSIRDDGNVSSITDRGTSRFTVNFSNSFGNSSYAATGNINNTGQGAESVAIESSQSNYIGSGFVMIHTTRHNAGFDPNHCNIIATGDG